MNKSEGQQSRSIKTSMQRKVFEIYKKNVNGSELEVMRLGLSALQDKLQDCRKATKEMRGRWNAEQENSRKLKEKLDTLVRDRQKRVEQLTALRVSDDVWRKETRALRDELCAKSTALALLIKRDESKDDEEVLEFKPPQGLHQQSTQKK
jgi:predicted nuclease with TOPRIM domain